MNKLYQKMPVNHEIFCENYFTKDKYFVFKIVVTLVLRKLILLLIATLEL